MFTRRSIRFAAGLFPLVLASSALAGTTGVIGTNFAGQAFFANSIGLAPPDTDGSIGPNHYVEFINSAFAIYNRSGGLVSNISDSAFWVAHGVTPVNGVSDTRILFDHASQRWFATEIDIGTGQ